MFKTLTLSLLLVSAISLFGCGKVLELEEGGGSSSSNAGPELSALPQTANETTDQNLRALTRKVRATPAQTLNPAGTKHTIRAKRIYGSPNKNFSREFYKAIPMEIPSRLPTEAGKPGNNWAFFSYTDPTASIGGATNITCAYRGNGSTPFTASCTSNGNAYRFRYCLSTADFETNDCKSDPNKPECRLSANILPINPKPTANPGTTNLINVSHVRLIVQNGDKSCLPETTVKMTFHVPALLTPNIPCGTVLQESLSLTSSVDCSLEQFAYALRGKNLTFNGGDYAIQTAPATLVGLFNFGDGNTFDHVDLTSVSGSSIGIFAISSNALNVTNSRLMHNWIGLDFMRVTGSLNLTGTTITDFGNTDIRTRTAFNP